MFPQVPTFSGFSLNSSKSIALFPGFQAGPFLKRTHAPDLNFMNPPVFLLIVPFVVHFVQG